MRQTIFGFNQQKAVQLGLTTEDLLLLDYIKLAQASYKMIHKEIDGISYVFLSHSHIHKDLPILSWSEGTLKNRVLRLKQLNIIVSVLDKNGSGTRAYYALTEFAQENLYFDLMHTEDNSGEVTQELPQRSFKNDVRGHLKMTSNNNLIDSNLKDNNTILKDSATELLSENISKESEEEETKEDIRPRRRLNFMNDDFSAKSYDAEKTERIKKPNLYQQCVTAIEEYTNDEALREKLKEYLPIRLKIKAKNSEDKRDSYKINGISQWKAILRKLDLLDEKDRLASVQQSIERNYASFFEVNKYSNKTNYRKPDCSVFGETPQMRSISPEEVEGGESSGIIF